MASADDAVDFLRLCVDADSTSRAESLEDLKFRFGDQWPTEIQNSRQLEARPCLTINETDAYIRQVTNQQRQQRPRIKVDPVDDAADVKIAKVITGLIRHIEVNSDADNAYDTAFDFAATMGFGYVRVLTDYTREDSFDQDIYLGHVENPFSVYFDPNSTEPDGSDAEKALITDMMPKSVFRKLYPGAQESNFTEQGTGEGMVTWQTKEDLRIAEYFYVERKKATLVKLSDGTITWSDMLPPVEILAQAGIRVVGDRESWKRAVRWCKQSRSEILEEKLWAGRWIPIVPVYGSTYLVEGKRRRFGLVRFAKDPQRMVNYWQTTVTELVALAPKAKWLIAEGQDEGHENEFAQANVKAMPVLRYKPTDAAGKMLPPPQRIQPEMVPAGAIENAMMASNNLQKVMGQYDPAIGKPSGPKSGTAINAEQRQSDQSNFHYYDNLTRSLKHIGRIILNLTPTVYDRERVVRIIGDDGQSDTVTINQGKGAAPSGDAGAIATVLNDLTVGEYDVVMDTGPGFNTKRIEAVNAMMQLASGFKELFPVAGDLIFRNMDFPGADVIADRLAAVNPLAKIDEKSDVPPQAQMMIKSLQEKLQQATQHIQQMDGVIKSRQDVEEIRSHTKLLAARMTSEGEKEERRITQAQKQHDTETYALTAQNVAEINALARILTSNTQQGHDLKKMLATFDHERGMMDRQQAAQAATEEGATVQ